MPFGSSKAAMMGAAGSGTTFDMEGGTRTTAGGYNYQTYTASGTVTVIGEGEVDVMLVGGGGSQYYNSYAGGGGGGGILYATGFTLEEGTYSLTIGAGSANTQANGGQTQIEIGGGWIAAGGGGFGGQAGWGYCNGGAPGVSNTGLTPPYKVSAGGGGGGGTWYGYCSGSGGSGKAQVDSGSLPTGSWSSTTSGNGKGGDVYAQGQAGGSGHANATDQSIGEPGYTWLDGNVYGSGGSGASRSITVVSAYGGGAGNGADPGTRQDAQNGVFICRWPE